MHLPQTVDHIIKVADKGEAPETPLILMAEIFAVLVPIAIVMLAIGFGLYYSFGGTS